MGALGPGLELARCTPTNVINLIQEMKAKKTYPKVLF
jgi:hypothetical protein